MMDGFRAVTLFQWLSGIGTITALGLSVFSLAVAKKRSTVAEENNLITGSNAWVTLLLKYVDEILCHAQVEQDCMRRVYSAAFATSEEKKKSIDSLLLEREAANKIIYFLKMLSPNAKDLCASRDALDLVDDSYLHNDDLEMDAKISRSLAKTFDSAFGSYLAALRGFAGNRNNLC